MTITGILVAIVAVFIRRPMEGLIDTTRRAALADTADTALRRMRRDLQRALPNSVRVMPTGAGFVIEFLPTVSGGRYCAEAGTTVAGVACTPLDFGAAVTSFDFIGSLPAFNAADVQEVAIYNLGIPGADAYNSDNTTVFGSVVGQKLGITAKQFPFASPGKRFQLIGGPVSYVCTPGVTGNNGTGTLSRVAGYAKQAIQSANPGGQSRLLANNVASCMVDYVQAAIDENGLLSLRLSLQSQGEIVSLTHEIEVNNVP